MYIFLVLISALFLGTYEVLKKISLKKSSVYETLFFYCLCGFIFSLIFVVEAISASFINILFVFLKSIIIVINWLLVLKALKKLDVGIVTPFSLVSTIITVFGSALIFKEKITWIHLLSLLFIAIGIILVTSLDNKQNKDKKENHYICLIFLIIGSILASCSALLDKYLINVRGMDSRASLVWFMFFNTIIYGIIYKFKNKRIEWIKIKENYSLIFTGLAIVLADISYYFSISQDNSQLSLISILRKSSVIVATILASVFLKEKNLLKKLGILLIMLIGIVLPIIFK